MIGTRAEVVEAAAWGASVGNGGATERRLSEAAIAELRRSQAKEALRDVGESQIRAFLTQLAVEGDVAPNTQNQAKSALLFLFRQVLNREIGFLDVVPADKPQRLPVVLSREEIRHLLPEFEGLRRLMLLVMYGAGLRHAECRRLRVKDVCFDEGHIMVRTGKGEKDRITVLPDVCRQNLIEQVSQCERSQPEVEVRLSHEVYLGASHSVRARGTAFDRRSWS